MTFEAGAEEFILEPFGWEVDDEGFIIDSESSERALDWYAEEEMRKEELAGVVEDENGETVLLRDNFVHIVEHTKMEIEREEGEA